MVFAFYSSWLSKCFRKIIFSLEIQILLIWESNPHPLQVKISRRIYLSVIRTKTRFCLLTVSFKRKTEVAFKADISEFPFLNNCKIISLFLFSQCLMTPRLIFMNYVFKSILNIEGPFLVTLNPYFMQELCEVIWVRYQKFQPWIYYIILMGSRLPSIFVNQFIVLPPSHPCPGVKQNNFIPQRSPRKTGSAVDFFLFWGFLWKDFLKLCHSASGMLWFFSPSHPCHSSPSRNCSKTIEILGWKISLGPRSPVR